MLKIREVIVVEGKYDKIKLSQIVDAVIITTDGFALYNNKQKMALLKRLASEKGIIVLTDSDSAGFRIRNYIKQCFGDIPIKHAYIPEIAGKEKRKDKCGAEGLLGVEGISDSLIIDALKKAGVTANENVNPITKADFYEFGLAGGKDSASNRQRLAKKMGLPTKLSANALLDVINLLYSREDFLKLF